MGGAVRRDDQGVSHPPQITREEVVRAGLHTVERVGLDALTMRRVAEHLGVQLNTVYWHVKSKPALLGAMADVLLAGIIAPDLPVPWRNRVTEIARRYRSALLRCRDGGRLSVARFAALPNTIALSEGLHQAFLDGGLSPEQSSHAAWSLSHLTLASVIEEQGDSADWRADWERRSPALATGGDLSTALRCSLDGDHRARFEWGIQVLLEGLGDRRG